MIRYGLKLWTSNREWFDQAAALHKEGAFDFIEMYINPKQPLDESGRKVLEGIPFGVHASHELDYFTFGPEELAVWRIVLSSAKTLQANPIVVHPGYKHTIKGFDAFKAELAKINDPRIAIETMSGLDGKGVPLYGADLETWKRFKELKPVCFDVEKAAKAAIHLKQDWKTYLQASLQELAPVYGHISGGEMSHAVDQHLDLWDSDMDWTFVKRGLEALPHDIRLVFETPKNGKDLQNDLDNMAFFRKVGA